MTARNSGLRVIAALSLALPLLLAGCTATAPHTSPSATAKDTVGLPSGVKQATNVPTEVPNDPSLRQNVTLKNCEKADGGWQASGIASNPGQGPVDYTISVFFTTDKGTVLGNADTKVTVDPGGKADWTVKAELTAAPKTLCILRGVG